MIPGPSSAGLLGPAFLPSIGVTSVLSTGLTGFSRIGPT